MAYHLPWIVVIQTFGIVRFYAKVYYQKHTYNIAKYGIIFACSLVIC
jgi:hypothetical protein